MKACNEHFIDTRPVALRLLDKNSLTNIVASLVLNPTRNMWPTMAAISYSSDIVEDDTFDCHAI